MANPTVKSCGFNDYKQVHSLLHKTYWAEDRTEETVKESLDNSLCYLIFDKENRKRLIGLARVVTDYSTMFWLCDVVVDENYRGNGKGKMLMEAIKSDPELDGLKGMLATRDAFELYEKYGFERVKDGYMQKLRTRD